MPKTAAEIIAHADQLGQRFQDYTPTHSDLAEAEALAGVHKAALGRGQAETQVLDAVAVARQAGVSWASIGALLGTSGEAARQRFATPTNTRR